MSDVGDAGSSAVEIEGEQVDVQLKREGGARFESVGMMKKWGDVEDGADGLADSCTVTRDRGEEREVVGPW